MTELESSAHRETPAWEQKFFDLIIRRHDEIKKEKPSLTIRKFAAIAGISPSTVCQILNRDIKWSLTTERALEVTSALSIPQNEINLLMVLMGKSPLISREQLPPSNYQILLDWTYLPILLSFDVTPKRSAEEMAMRLNVTEEKVRAVIEDLRSRGYLKSDASGNLYRDKTYWETSDGISNEYIRKHHQSSLEVGSRALNEVPVHERDFKSLTFTGNKEQIAHIKDEIRRLLEKVTALAEGSSPPDEVYKISVQLFPFDFRQSRLNE